MRKCFTGKNEVLLLLVLVNISYMRNNKYYICKEILLKNF